MYNTAYALKVFFFFFYFILYTFPISINIIYDT